MTAGGSTKRCSDNWLKMGVHKEVTTFGARWSEIYSKAGSKRIFTEERS